MDNTQIIEKLRDLKEKVKSKQGRLFFFVADTQGTPMASIEYIYRIAKILHDDGHLVFMLHEKEKFIGVRDWMGEEYSNLTHISLTTMNDNKNFQITGADTFFIPELYADFFKKLWESKLPSDTVIICQSHTFVFKYLNASESWSYYNIDEVITTSNKMKSFLEEYQRTKNIYVVNPPITSEFSVATEPQKPIISIISRVPEDIERVAKLFYQKYPIYSWVTFRTLGNMKKENFAQTLKETCVAVWLDDYSSFGTFPLECMASGVPVIVKIPDLIPEWAEEFNPQDSSIKLSDNAIYVSNILAMPDYIAKFLEAWFLGDVPDTLYKNMKTTAAKYSEENFKEQTKRTFEKIFERKLGKIDQTIKKYE